MTVTTTRHDTVTVLNLGDDENRFSPDWLDRVDAALDEIEAGEPTALVTVANGKFYSNGLDLQWLSANGEKAQWYVDRVHGLFARVLTLPVPTIAAINGHAFGAGAMLALAHDFRVMRTDRGFFCLPEVDIRLLLQYEPQDGQLAEMSEPQSLHDPGGYVSASIADWKTPTAVLLGADGLLAGGPATGFDSISEFIADVYESLHGERPPAVV